MTDAAGARVERTIYRPHGNWASNLTSQFPGAGPVESRGYIGERLDADAGLLYLNARYMAPQLGMFIQPDWWAVTEPGVGTNRYAYAGGDPVNGSDPGGNQFLKGGVEGGGPGLLIGALVLGFAKHEAANSGHILADPINNPNFGQEGHSIDDGGLNTSVLGDPMGSSHWSDGMEGMSLEGPTGPTILSNPIDEGSLQYNIVYASKLRNELGLSKGDGLLAHHKIPQALRNNPAVQAAERAGFDMDGRENGMVVIGQAGGHPAYNQGMERALDDLWEKGNQKGWTDAQFLSEVERIGLQAEGRIIDWGGYVKNANPLVK